MASGYRKKTVLPHNYSKVFHDYWLPYEKLWASLKKRLEIEKDALILVTGSTGVGKSHMVGNLCFKLAQKEDNFVVGDGSKMFIPEEDFIIDPDEFAYKMINKKGNVLWIDESRDSIARRNWASKINKTIISRKNKNRKLRKIVFLLLPYEKEIDSEMAKHVHLWMWVKERGVVELYCSRTGIKGGIGLNIQGILDREEKYFKENPRKSMCPPIVHPEYIGRLGFGKLTAGLERKYNDLVDLKKATGDFTDEEKEKYGIEIKVDPKVVIKEAIQKIKNGEIQDKKTLWESLDGTDLEDDKKLKLLNFHLKLEDWGTFDKLFKKSSRVNSPKKVW